METPTVLYGHAAVFNSLSADVGGFIEKLLPGCFRNALAKCDARALVNHDPRQLLGRLSAGTLRMVEDKTGLLVEIDAPDTAVGRDTAYMVRRGDYQGQSFSFTVAPGGDSWDLSGPKPIRTVREIGELFDVGPVTFPAYARTTISVRSSRALSRERPAPPAHRIELEHVRERLRLLEVT